MPRGSRRPWQWTTSGFIACSASGCFTRSERKRSNRTRLPNALIFQFFFINDPSPHRPTIKERVCTDTNNLSTTNDETSGLSRLSRCHRAFRPLCFYRKSDAKPVHSARRPMSTVTSNNSRKAPEGPAPWFIACHLRGSGRLLRRNKTSVPRLSN